MDRISHFHHLNAPNVISIEATSILTQGDIDSNFKNTENERGLISDFLTACRHLSYQMDRKLVIRTSIRSSVWVLIREKMETLGKCEQYILYLRWSNKEIGEILAKRIKIYMRNKLKGTEKEWKKDIEKYLDDISNEEVLYLIFHKFLGPKRHPNYVVINNLSNRNPRWAVQLCRLSAEKVCEIEPNRKKISYDFMMKIMHTFGQLRFRDLISEYEHQCSKLRFVIMSFSNQKSHYSIREFLKHIEQNILLNHEIDIDGNYKITDPMIIANFLYRIRFIIAKNVSNGTYYNFDERPSLLENKDNKNYSLDIPSCFEQYLNLE